MAINTLAAARPFALGSARILDEITLLNRAVYGGDDDMHPEFRQDYRPARDPNDVGNRSALNVYDRYDLYLKQFGFKTLSAAELGFTAAQRSASETSDGLDRNFTYAGDLYRNNFQKLSDGTLVPFTDAGAVAIAAVKETAAGKTLHLVFRGTDADLGKDGEAGTGQGQVRYYQQLKPLIDQALEYVKNARNGIDEVVVSGHSLGGAMADMFAVYDGAKFAAVQGLKFKVVALASAGIDPATLAIKTDYNRNIVTQDAEGISFRTPSWYSQYDHSEDIVRNPERYNTARHAEEDPQQAPITRAAVSTLLEHIHFEEGRLEIEAPLIDQYEISKNFSTNFLSEHYASFYERVGEGVAAGAPYARNLDFDRFITLHGENDTLIGTQGHNNLNGWNVPIDNTRSYARSTADIFIMGLSGEDRITTGSGADLLSGGFGNDTLFGGAGADILVGLDENDLLYGQSGADRLHGGQGTDILYGSTGADQLQGQGNNDRLFGGSSNDLLAGDAGNDRLAGGLGADRLLGGFGRDAFVFNTAPASGNADTIVLFSHADDTIRLAESVFSALGDIVTSGELRIAATADAARATQDNDHLIYNKTTGQLYYDADGVGGAFKTIVATLTNLPDNLAFDDFLMV